MAFNPASIPDLSNIPEFGLSYLGMLRGMYTTMGSTEAKARILIVEDERAIAKCLKMMLSREGYKCDIVSTGKDAIDAALVTRPDLILMDIRLRGDIDGITAYEQLKETMDIPVIFVSAYGDKHVIARAMQCKPSGYIVKPFKRLHLISEVEKALEWRKLQKRD